jgi:hypothetical protein
MRMIHRGQQGFTTVTLMGVLMVGGLLVAASFAAVDPDIGLTKKDDDSKQAYAAAEAGVNYYMNRLGQDINYYLKCTNVPNPAGPGTSPVNQVWNGTGADPRTFYNIPGFTAKYAIELLPVTSGGYTSCVQNQQGSMIDPSTGALRIRSTGISGKRKRSIIATIRRKSFIDFLYFTNYETSDPATYGTLAEQQYASDNCKAYRAQRGADCNEISFISDDNVAGPLHTNDDAKVCGSPTFGRNTSDLIELNGTSPGWSSSCGSASPVFNGTRKWPAGILPMPTSNAALASVAAPAFTFSGETRIQVNGTSMTVTTAAGTQTLNLPAGAIPGVVYVKSTSCPGGYKRKQTIPSPLPSTVPFSGDASLSGCGNVYVSGTYSTDLTIGADNDIIVTDDVKPTSSTSGALLGLIANNFVRVYHPVNNWSNNDTDCSNNGGPGSIEIDAAILAIQHSFINDNWYCGNPLGTLTVNGAIAQQFRGPVGTHSGSSISSGYAKAYTYDDDLRYREPPYFIDPAISPWQVIRQNEQVPPR